MIVRYILTESANQSRLFRSNKLNCFNALVHFSRDKLTHSAFARTAIKRAAIVRQHSLRTACASVYRRFGGFAVYVVADANDHRDELMQMRMIVKFTCE